MSNCGSKYTTEMGVMQANFHSSRYLIG